MPLYVKYNPEPGTRALTQIADESPGAGWTLTTVEDFEDWLVNNPPLDQNTGYVVSAVSTVPLIRVADAAERQSKLALTGTVIAEVGASGRQIQVAAGSAAGTYLQAAGADPQARYIKTSIANFAALGTMDVEDVENLEFITFDGGKWYIWQRGDNADPYIYGPLYIGTGNNIFTAVWEQGPEGGQNNPFGAPGTLPLPTVTDGGTWRVPAGDIFVRNEGRDVSIGDNSLYQACYSTQEINGSALTFNAVGTDLTLGTANMLKFHGPPTILRLTLTGQGDDSLGGVIYTPSLHKLKELSLVDNEVFGGGYALPSFKDVPHLEKLVLSNNAGAYTDTYIRLPTSLEEVGPLASLNHLEITAGGLGEDIQPVGDGGMHPIVFIAQALAAGTTEGGTVIVDNDLDTEGGYIFAINNTRTEWNAAMAVLRGRGWTAPDLAAP
jgi:hypothetical protein